jgi:hypothetical protein
MTYRVTAKRISNLRNWPCQKDYCSKFIQDFKTSSEAFETYFKLLPEFQEVTIEDLRSRKTVVMND